MGRRSFFPRGTWPSRESSQEETRRRKRIFGRTLATSLSFSLDERSRPSASRTGRGIRDRLPESFVDADPRRRRRASTLTIASSDGGRLKAQPAEQKTEVVAHLRSCWY